MTSPKNVKATVEPVKGKQWKVHSISRGKEIKVIFENGTEKKELLVHLFKGGIWEWYENYEMTKLNPNYDRDHRFSLYFTDGTIMSQQDQFHQSHWKWTDNWGLYRSPDIVTENNAYRLHLFTRRKHWHFKKPIFIIMLHPWFFNGINNFTRTEILCRTSFSPFTPATEIFKSVELREEFFDTMKEVLEEVYHLGGTQLGLWKNPFGVDPKKLKEWIQVYKKRDESWIVENKKLFYFDRKWNNDPRCKQISKHIKLGKIDDGKTCQA
jgi:formamidopyrimidine-DNA glycosylase